MDSSSGRSGADVGLDLIWLSSASSLVKNINTVIRWVDNTKMQSKPKKHAYHKCSVIMGVCRPELSKCKSSLEDIYIKQEN